MEDWGECKWVLGMRVTRSRSAHTIGLHQDQYIEKMLAKFGIKKCKPAATHIPQQPSIVPILETPVDKNFSFFRGVGLLNYLVQCTRPDLAFSWSYLSQFLNKHTITHQHQFLHLLRYLKRTKTLGINLGGNTTDAFSLKAYCDPNHASCSNHCSFTGKTVLINGPVMSQFSKQLLIDLLNMEANHQSCYESGQDLLWTSQLRSLLSKCFNSSFPSPALYCDNQGAIALLENPFYHY